MRVAQGLLTTFRFFFVMVRMAEAQWLTKYVQLLSRCIVILPVIDFLSYLLSHDRSDAVMDQKINFSRLIAFSFRTCSCICPHNRNHTPENTRTGGHAFTRTQPHAQTQSYTITQSYTYATTMHRGAHIQTRPDIHGLDVEKFMGMCIPMHKYTYNLRI